MNLSAVLSTLAVLAAADARTFFQRPAQFQPLPSLSEGSANANINSGISLTPLGLAQIQELTSDSAGRTEGLGSSSVNTASTNARRTETINGVQQALNADSNSVQDTSRIGVQAPFSSLFRPFSGGARGNSNSGVTLGLTEGAGGATRLVSVSSNSGGEAHNGGSNLSAGRAGNRRTETVNGVDEASHADSVSVQRSRR